MNNIVFGAVALDDISTLRVQDLRTVVVPKIAASVEIACAADMKLRGKVAILDSTEGVARFVTVVCSHVAAEKKVIHLIKATGSEPLIARFEAVASQCLSRLVTRMPALGLAPGATVASPKTPKGGKTAKAAVVTAVPDAPLAAWIKPTADLIFLVLVEALLAFWQRTANMQMAEKLSMDNAQTLLRRDLTEDDLAVSAALLVMRRQGDFDLVHSALPANMRLAPFAADLLSHLPSSVKAKITLFDEAANMTLPPGTTFQERLADPKSHAACLAQLGAWATAAKAEKQEFKKAVAHSVAALTGAPLPLPAAAMPGAPAVPRAAAPRAGSRSNRDYCIKCDQAGRPSDGHSRETCPHYRCHGCGVVSPGHVYRNCPNPAVGGPCPPHNH